MAHKSLFRSLRAALHATARNLEHALAYQLPPRAALAQYAATGCLNRTFYASAERQLAEVLQLADAVDPEFLARAAVHARERGRRKDLPALLCAVLSVRAPRLLEQIFPRVIDDAKMLRNFVQILRSGRVGRRSLGTLPRRLVRRWLEARTDEQLFAASVGQSPALADIIRLVHPRPGTKAREALFGHLLGREVPSEALPPAVQAYRRFLEDPSGEPPDVPFQMLTSQDLSAEAWATLAKRASWSTARISLNTFARHGVFELPGMPSLIAEKLRDREALRRARAYPYQLLATLRSLDPCVPGIVREALVDALEASLGSVPALEGAVWICPDVSGSMASPISGHRQGATTVVRCVDVAALVAAAFLRKCPQAGVLPFEQRVVEADIGPANSILANVEALSALGGGGTSCSAPLALLNARHTPCDLVILVSDNQSWFDDRWGPGTEAVRQWRMLRRRCPRARLVCLDLQPYGTTQAPDDDSVLNIGGFSDDVFEVISAFAGGRLGADHWVGVIEAVALAPAGSA